MDKTDLLLCMQLLNNSRMPYRALAAKLNLSVNAVHKRVQLLIQSGVLRTFTTGLTLHYLGASQVTGFGPTGLDSIDDLVARAKAILRRSGQQNIPTSGQVIKLGDLVIDPARREVHCNGKLVPLRTQEFEVLYVLAQHKGLVLSRDQLLNQAWGFDFAGQTRTVDVHIAQLRGKLLDCQVKIETVTGIGYKLVA
ncbi:MAG: winged helix-turn-helix domain-containing protein [Anaerolineaceae bacterium]